MVDMTTTAAEVRASRWWPGGVLGSLFAQQTLFLAAALGLWEFLGAYVVDPFWSSRPSLIGERLWFLAKRGDLTWHMSATLTEAGLGRARGSVIGVSLGLLMARYTRAARITERVALAPLFILWFGIGLQAKVMMSFSMVVFVFVLNVLEGVRALDRDPIDLMKTMGASNRYIVRRVLLPAVLTWIIASFRISVGLALIGALVGELIGSSRGLGWYIERSAGQLDTTGVFTGIIVLVAIAMVANNIVALVSNRLTRWRA
jgi:NitT/TauT family transport system permease protein